uniref:Ovule protein n=1 Tax=Schistosoma mansoni TaxID=6183 RepID=A0A5K4F8F3_SCHMA
MYNSGSKVTSTCNHSNISALSEYTKMVFLILGIEIAITLLIIIILSPLETVHKTPNPWTVLPWILMYVFSYCNLIIIVIC